ncbi:MAG: hypothetical protein QOK47_309 [Actinomycetota bacterium]|jgi:hypothetical protein|nr:hypothetical protein [Actinomycetota bacterium]
MRRSAITGVGVLALLLVATSALAANVHWKSGPTFSDQGTTLSVSGALAGLGNQDVTIKVTANGVATSITCTNPAGKNAPGQNKPRVQSLGDLTVSRTEIKNGNVSFRLTTRDPAQLTAKQAGCPNNQWTAKINDVEFDDATITVVQGGKTVLQGTFDV